MSVVEPLKSRVVKRSTILQAQLSSQGIALPTESEFDRQVSQAHLTIASNQYRREPDEQGRWPCSMCYMYKPLDEYHLNVTMTNGHEGQCKVCRCRWKREYTKTRKSRPVVVKKTARPDHKICSKCKVEKHVDEFHKDATNVTGCNSACKECVLSRKKKRTRTLHGCFRGMLDSAILHAKNQDLGPVTITIEDIAALYAQQKGKCAISKIELTWEPHSKFKMSLERKDNNISYILSNVHIIIAQMNTVDQTKYSDPELKTGSSQWTEDKWILAHTLYEPCYSQERQIQLVQQLQAIKKRKSNFKHKETKPGIWTCAQCGDDKPLTAFGSHGTRKPGHSSSCKTCEWRLRDNVPKYLRELHSSMKQRAAVKGLDCTVTLEDLKELAFEQNGLCAISRIPMVFRRLSNWQCSVERKNNALGYIRSNIALICLEFQSSDHSRVRGVDPADVEFTAQWTVDLYMEVFWPNGGSETPETWTFDKS